MDRITDDNKYMDNAMEELKQRKVVHVRVAVTADEGIRPDGYAIAGWGKGAVVFGLSSGDLPSSSGSAGETVVVDGVNVFLDLDAIVLGIVREMRSATVAVATRRGAIGFPASRTGEIGVPVYTSYDPCSPLCVGCFSRSESCCSP